MRKVHSYLIEKDGEKYIRVVDGELVEIMALDYQKSSFKELQIAASFALKHIYRSNTEEGKMLQKIGLDNLIMYRGGHHIKLVKDGEMKDLGLFHVTEFLLEEFDMQGTSVPLSRVALSK